MPRVQRRNFRVIHRTLLTLAALTMIVGGIAHALSYAIASAQLSATSLNPALKTAYDVVWLLDSSNLGIGALALLVVAWRPGSTSSLLLAVLGLVPLFTAIIIYAKLGFFYGGHMLLGAALLVFAAASLSLPWTRSTRHSGDPR